MTRPNETVPVAVSDIGATSYPHEAPFDPPERYPELPADAWHLDPTNRVYAGVRETFRLLGLDEARYGAANWNPLGDLVHPGDRVVIKPNLVRHFHGDGGSLEALVTHGSVVRAVLDYVVIALKGSGSVTVGDAPLQYSDLTDTASSCGLDRVLSEVTSYARVPLRLVDFRKERSEKRDGLIVTRVPNDGDPEGYQVVDLKQQSRFSGMPLRRMRRFRVTQYDPRTMRQAHNAGTHAYLFPASILRADVLINLPKLKTHRKAGITGALKNLVGINGSKDFLPHHTAGATEDGGDEYRRRSPRKWIVSALRDAIEGRRSPAARRLLHQVERLVKATGRIVPFPDPYWEGSWHGNDTVWRMVHDLHRVLLLADPAGIVRPLPQRRCLALVDAIVAGEGDGPMRPTARPAGLLIAGVNAAAVDLVCCRVMGFDEMKVPLLRNAIGADLVPGVPSLDAIRVVSNSGRWRRPFELTRDETLAFTPPSGWADAIELPG